MGEDSRTSGQCWGHCCPTSYLPSYLPSVSQPWPSLPLATGTQPSLAYPLLILSCMGVETAYQGGAPSRQQPLSRVLDGWSGWLLSVHKVIAAFPGRCIHPCSPFKEEELKNPFFRPLGPSLVSGNTSGFSSGEDRKATLGAFKTRAFLQPRPELAKVSASPRWAGLLIIFLLSGEHTEGQACHPHPLTPAPLLWKPKSLLTMTLEWKNLVLLGCLRNRI